MEVLGSHKEKVLRWANETIKLINGNQAEVDPKCLFLEDTGDELRVSYVLKIKHSLLDKKSQPKPEPVRPVTTVTFMGKMTPIQAKECYDITKRQYVCPACKTFTTSSETGIKKHFNKCEKRQG